MTVLDHNDISTNLGNCVATWLVHVYTFQSPNDVVKLDIVMTVLDDNDDISTNLGNAVAICMVHV